MGSEYCDPEVGLYDCPLSSAQPIWRIFRLSVSGSVDSEVNTELRDIMSRLKLKAEVVLGQDQGFPIVKAKVILYDENNTKAKINTPAAVIFSSFVDTGYCISHWMHGNVEIIKLKNEFFFDT